MIQRVYDLKGSLHKRMNKKVSGKKSVRKDLNFLKDTDVVLKLSPEEKKDFRSRLYYDAQFLKSQNLMDYSLLLIVFEKKEYREEEDLEDGHFRNITLKVPPKVMRS